MARNNFLENLKRAREAKTSESAPAGAKPTVVEDAEGSDAA